jgi:helicase
MLNERLRHGVKEDALELVRLRYIGRVRARILLNYGIKSVEDIIKRKDEVVKLLGEGWGEKIVKELISSQS